MNPTPFHILVKTILFFSMLALPLGGRASCDDPAFHHFGLDEGLSANHVKAILRGSDGFVWIGTVNGLNRYDGSTIKTYQCRDNKLNRGNNNIGVLYEDHDRRIWLGTDRGVYIYSPETDNIDYVSIWDEEVGCLNWVQRIVGDDKGNMWVLVPDQGIFRKSQVGAALYRMPSGSKYKEDYFNDICIDSDGDLWACSSNGKVFRYDKGYDEMVEVTFPLPESARLGRILPYGEQVLLVAEEHGQMWRLMPKKDYAAVRIPFSLPENSYLRSVAIIDNEIWAATQNGLFLLDTESGKRSHYISSQTDETSLSDNTLYTLYADSDKNLWIGTVFGGVNYTERNTFHFCTIEPPEPDSRRIRGLALCDENKRIVVGSVSNGLSLYDIPGKRFLPFPEPLSIHDPIMCVANSDGSVMIGPDRMGLWRYEPGKVPSRYLPRRLSNENTVYSYLKDSRGDEWVGLSYALFRRRKGEEEFERVEQMHYRWIFALMEDSDGNIWIGTMGTGLFRYNSLENSFSEYVYHENADRKEALRSNSINSIMQDSKGRIWISTDRGGLSRYEKGSDRFITFGIEEGLPDNVVYPVVEDKTGFLWFGTNRGLVRMDGEGERVVVYTKADGLPANEFTYNSALCTPDSVMYFGTVNGIVSFKPYDTLMPEGDYSVMFTSITFPDPERYGEIIGERNILHCKELSIPFGANTFSITVGVPASITLRGTKRYSYRLIPGDGNWIPMDGTRISFTNLRPSTYTIEVRMECGEIESASSIRLRILPPWWLSGWAIAGYVLLLLGIIALFLILYRRRELKRMKERQEIFASNKEKEVYRQKLNFFTEIAHEIRTPLSLIDLPLEAMEEEGLDKPQAEHYLKVTRENTARLLELTSQLLDFQKVESGKLRLKPEAVDITELVRHIVDRFEPSVSLKGKTIVTSLPKESVVAVTDREAVTKIVSNLLNNALKYAAGSIEVKMESRPDCVDIKVISDGEKITGDNRARIFETFYQTDRSQEQKNGVGIGLPLSRSLAILLGGSLTLADEDRSENVFILCLPLTESNKDVALAPAEEHTGYLLEEMSNQTPLSANGYHILLVEDNEGIRKMLEERLSGSFLVATASNGKEALTTLQTKTVDLIVTDIMMPEMDGLELCRKVKENPDLAHIPVVFITAKNDLESKVRGLQLGAEAYIEKPFSVKYLREMIVTLLENRRRAREAFAKKPFFQAEEIPVNREDEKFMEKILGVIKENMGDEDFNVEQLCDKMCMSRSSLLRKVKAVFNLSPGELIRIVRLKSAAELIKGGGYTLGEISNKIGVSSQSYFTKMFFKQFNIMPNEFARQFAKD